MPIIEIIKRYIRAYTNARANWGWIKENPIWVKAVKLAQMPDNMHVLIATSTGANWACSSFDSLLGVALTLRGVRVTYLLCDGVLSACQECDLQWYPEKVFLSKNMKKILCGSCYNPAKKMLTPLGLPIITFGELLDNGNSIKIEPIDQDEHARSGVLRYYARGTVPENNYSQNIYLEYQKSSILSQQIIKNLLKKNKVDVAIIHHGIYVPQGAIREEFIKNNIRTINWIVSYRSETILLSHKTPPNSQLPNESNELWVNLSWNKAKEREILNYLASRQKNGNDWISFQPKKNDILTTDIINKKIKSNKPLIGMLTNVMWDAQINFKNNAFPSMIEWIDFTINYFIRRQDLQLLIRVHPAEIKGSVPSRQPIIAEIQKRFPKLPDNIIIVEPSDNISTYDLMFKCDSVLVYGTKTALELACFGKQVVVCGEAWCKGKGFTLDPKSPDEYLSYLNNLPLKKNLSNGQIELARRYAHYIFFKRMIKIKALEKIKFFSPFKVKRNCLELLVRGGDPNLDIICNGIITGSEYISSDYGKISGHKK